MKLWKSFTIVGLIVALGIGYSTHQAEGGKKVDTRVFELRTYYAAPGKMDACTPASATTPTSCSSNTA